MLGVCFHCHEQIRGPEAYHIVTGIITQMNHEMPDIPHYLMNEESLFAYSESVRTTMEVVTLNKVHPEQTIKSFHRECFLTVAGEEYL